LPDELEEEDEEAETEVDKVLGEILQDKMSKVAATPVTPTPVATGSLLRKTRTRKTPRRC